MILSTLLFCTACFIVLLFMIPIGVKLYEFSKGVSAIFILILVALTPYLLAIFIKSSMSSFNYKWYHLIVLILMIGAMNNANLKGEAKENAKFASTFLFGSFVLMSIIMLWLI